MKVIIPTRWLVVFLIFPHLSIYFLKTEQFSTVTLIWQSSIILVAIFVFFTNLNKFNNIMILNLLTILSSTYLNGILTSGTIFYIGVFIGFCIYISYAIKNFREFITGLYYLSVIVVIANFVTLFSPTYSYSGQGQMIYFLGGKNQFALTIVPVISIVYMYSYTVYKKIKVFPMIIIFLGVLSIFIAGSGTGMVIAMLTTAYIFAPIRKFPSFNGYLLIYISAFFAIVVYRIQEILFGNFIVNVLGKDLTFTNRTYIWDLVIELYKDKWFLGAGRGNTIIFDWLPILRVNEAHNGILQILLDTGIIGVLLFLILIFVVGKKIKSNKSHDFSKILSFSLFAFLIIGLTESAFYRKEFWILLIMAYGLDKITKQVDLPVKTKVNNKSKSHIPIELIRNGEFKEA